MSGLCECGCGQRTNLAPQTVARKGWRRGEPIRFVHGHNAARGPLDESDYTAEDRGYSTPCWIWARVLNREGYGKAADRRRARLAHRLMYEQRVGPIPAGLHLDHLCRVRECVNPEHLEPVTPAENVLRSARTKLSDADREAIRADARIDREVAADYGVSRATVQRVQAQS